MIPYKLDITCNPEKFIQRLEIMCIEGQPTYFVIFDVMDSSESKVHITKRNGTYKLIYTRPRLYSRSQKVSENYKLIFTISTEIDRVYVSGKINLKLFFYFFLLFFFSIYFKMVLSKNNSASDYLIFAIAPIIILYMFFSQYFSFKNAITDFFYNLAEEESV